MLHKLYVRNKLVANDFTLMIFNQKIHLRNRLA